MPSDIAKCHPCLPTAGLKGFCQLGACAPFSAMNSLDLNPQNFPGPGDTQGPSCWTNPATPSQQTQSIWSPFEMQKQGRLGGSVG